MDFLGSRRVLPMNIAERGAYFQLLILAWDDPFCSLPADDRELKQMALWIKKWGSFERVRACFTEHPEHPGRLYNARLYEEWEYCQGKSKSAQGSARKRWEQEAATRNAQAPTRKINDRSGKGFTQVGSEIQVVADKHFPPIP